MMNKFICFGEIVWDALPMSIHLGGAPFNVAAHLAKQNASVRMVSRIGDDMLGDEVIRNMENLGMNTGLIQVDPRLNTGFVKVELKENEPSYEIVNPSSWDNIEYTNELEKALKDASVLIYGTLSQRNETTRSTLKKLWKSPCMKVLDINLRPPFIDRNKVEESLAAADMVKLNEAELSQLQDWFFLPGDPETAIRELAKHFNCKSVCLTRGAEGSMLLHENKIITQKGIEVEVADTIGAGDAFLATLILSLVNGEDGRTAMNNAGKIAAFVASRNGAVPEYDTEELKNLYQYTF